MTISSSETALEYFGIGARRRRFRLRLSGPHSTHGIIFGFLFRFVTGVLAVLMPTVLLIVIGYFNGWQLTAPLLVFYGGFISSIVFYGEHIRSRVYERIATDTKSTSLVNLVIGVDPTKGEKGGRLPLDQIGPEPVKITRSGKAGAYAKRALDIVASSLGLILLSPLFVVVAAFIKLDSAGPIFVRRTKRGFDGRDFKLLTFRTRSTVDSGELTDVGRFLRRLSQDELPALLNVLRGDMSLVGPRLQDETLSKYPLGKTLFKYASRHYLKPGITGWAQIHGYANARTVDQFARKFEYDLWYAQNWSVGLDLKIIFRTVIIIGAGAHPDGLSSSRKPPRAE
jgi:lipopolysaccharide/colanic/teichoic acid biosynthesis glycosyltransferase